MRGRDGPLLAPGTRRRLRTFFWIVGISIVAGAAYGSLARLIAFDEPLQGAAIGVIRGLTIAAMIGGLEIFGTRTRLGRVVEAAPFLVTLTVKTVVYSAVIVGVEAVNLGVRFVTHTGYGRPFGGVMAPISIAFSFAGTFLVVFILNVGGIVGWRTLGRIVTGRYHHPRTEERVFLFVDVAGSTALAERLGPEAVHRFLDRVFRLAADPVEDHRGEIYQYVGDEMVVTWTVAAARKGARPIACFFAIEDALEEVAATFTRDFGATPRLRGALHAGPVIAGEIGESKRDVVFHGDVMNTASRVEQLTRDLDRRFLVSADALARLDAGDRYVIDDLGAQTVRGRAAPVHVFAVEPQRGIG